MYVLRIMIEMEDDSLVSPSVNVEEVARILREVVHGLEGKNLQQGDTFRGTVRDINGNKVCSYNLENTR